MNYLRYFSQENCQTRTLFCNLEPLYCYNAGLEIVSPWILAAMIIFLGLHHHQWCFRGS